MEYYVLKNHKENGILLGWEGDVTHSAVYSSELIDPSTITMFVTDKLKNNPTMFDFHTACPYPVISTKIKEILESFNPFRVQYIKAIVITNNFSVHENYYYLHVVSRIACLDKEKSKFKFLSSGMITSFKKLALDNVCLKRIKKENRLIFRLDEAEGIYLFHKSVVDAVMSINPTGLQFCPVQDWNSFLDFQ